MADRTVKVSLTLDVGDFRSGARSVIGDTVAMDTAIKALGNDVDHLSESGTAATAKVKGLGATADRTGEQVKQVGDKAKKASEQVDGLGDEVKGLGDETDKTSEDIGGLADETGKLDAKLAAAKVRVRELVAEFDRTGDLTLFKDLRDQQSTVGTLTRMRTELQGIRRDEEHARQNVGNTGSGLLDFAIDDWLKRGIRDGFAGAKDEVSKGLQSIGQMVSNNPYLAAGIAGGIVVGIPLIVGVAGAAMAAAVETGLGGGALALGISRAVADPRVSEAWGGLADKATHSLDAAAGGFVEPLVAASRTLGVTWDRDVTPSLNRALSSMAPLVDQLAVGLSGFVRELAPGFDKAMASAAPFIEILAEELPYIGEAMSSFLGHVANAGPGAQQLFQDILIFAEQAIRVTGWLIEYGSNLYMTFTALGELLAGNFSNAKQIMDDIWSGDGAKDANKALQEYRDTVPGVVEANGVLGTDFAALNAKIGQTAVTADALAAKMVGQVFNSMMTLDQAVLGFAESQTRLSESLQRNGTELDIHTAKGQANREAILSSVQANMAQYQANRAAGMSAEDAADAYDTNTTALEGQMRAAGLTQGQIDGLIGKYRGVPDKVDTEIAMHGLTDAINGLSTMIGMVNGIKNRDVYITTHFQNVGTLYSSPDRVLERANRWGGLTEHAASGLLKDASLYSPAGPARYAFAEPATGGEAFVPKYGNYGRSMSILNHAAGWYGASVVPGGGGGGSSTAIYLTVNAGIGTDGQRVGQQIVELIRPVVRSGGGNVQVVLGKPGA